MIRQLFVLSLFAGAVAAAAAPASLAGIEKKAFEIPRFVTVGGRALAPVRFGYETYGKLNAAGDNAILVTHHFTGTSHAAGRYRDQAEDVPPGEWDYLIGPGKSIDTDRYFVVSADTLSNMNTGDPHVITTGPRSIDPRTGQPYGMSFPVVTIRDFVAAQHALAVSLGIRRWFAVIGASMGSMQALEWATDYPDMVARAVAVVPAGLAASPHLIETLHSWMAVVENDPRWNGGSYGQREGVMPGLANALNLLLLQSQNTAWTQRTPYLGEDGLAAWAAPGIDPKAGFGNAFAIEKAVDGMKLAFGKNLDPDSFLYIAKAVQLYQLGQAGDPAGAIRRIRAAILLLPARSDLLLFPQYAVDAYRQLRAAGKRVTLKYIEGNGGHVDGIRNLMRVSETLRDFLAR
jgi:homoserine O-acetyltransferase